MLRSRGKKSLAILNRIVGGSMEVDNDEIDED